MYRKFYILSDGDFKRYIFFTFMDKLIFFIYNFGDYFKIYLSYISKRFTIFWILSHGFGSKCMILYRKFHFISFKGMIFIILRFWVRLQLNLKSVSMSRGLFFAGHARSDTILVNRPSFRLKNLYFNPSTCWRLQLGQKLFSMSRASHSTGHATTDTFRITDRV